MTWVNLTANAKGKVAGFVDWGWAIGGCHKSSCEGMNLPDQAIFATMYEHAGDWDTAWDPDVHFVRSDDWFKSIKQKVGLLVTNRLHVVSVVGVWGRRVGGLGQIGGCVCVCWEAEKTAGKGSACVMIDRACVHW